MPPLALPAADPLNPLVQDLGRIHATVLRAYGQAFRRRDVRGAAILAGQAAQNLRLRNRLAELAPPEPTGEEDVYEARKDDWWKFLGAFLAPLPILYPGDAASERALEAIRRLAADDWEAEQEARQ